MTNEYIADCDFEELLSKYDYRFQKGDIVKGIVCSYDKNGVNVDIGAKTSACVPIKEALIDNKNSVEDVLKKNEQYEFLIIREEDEDGQFLLSYKKVAIGYSWRELEDKKIKDEVIQGIVVDIVKGGLIVEVLEIKGFVPSSHVRVKMTDDLIGQKIDLKILSMDFQQGNFILSNKS